MPVSMIEASALQRLVYRQDPGAVLSFVCVLCGPGQCRYALSAKLLTVLGPWSSGDRSEKK